MKRTSSLKLIGAVTLALMLALSANLVWANSVQVSPSNSNPYGMDYGQWGAAWWQWVVLSTPDNHVLYDTTGQFAHNNQPVDGSVFFLGGTYTGTAVTRNVTVSAGKAFFFPIFNWLLSFPEDVPAAYRTSEAAAEGFIRDTLDTALKIGGDYLANDAGLRVLVDGVDVLDHSPGFSFRYRGTSPAFSIYFAPDSFTVLKDSSGITGESYQAGLHYPSVSDGYWVMLGPLDLGMHEIHILASGNYGLYQDVTYELNVVPLPSTLLLLGSGLLGLLGIRRSRQG
jgi:hypothetical protein